MPDAWLTHDLPFDPGNADDLRRFEQREWLLTAGDGSYAMGTALGRNTRRYHGLLVAAAHPPVDRVLALHQLVETLLLSHGENHPPQRLEFSTNGFRDEHGQTVYAPHGFRFLRRVQRGLTMAWHYQWGDLHWSRTLVLHPTEKNHLPHPPAATLRYDVQPYDPSLGQARLELSPLLTLRGFHGLYDGRAIETKILSPDVITCATDQHAATLSVPGGVFTEHPDVWRSNHYPRETQRGQGDTEDLIVPGRFVVPVTPGQPVTFTACLGEQPADPLAYPQARAERLAVVRKTLAVIPSPTAEALTIAADDFLVARPVKGKQLCTILAGYPWFADWGRDAFIALPGLLLTTGRLDDAADVLQCFASVLRGGLVPNRFDDKNPDDAHYNTVDGSMWFVHAGLCFAEALGQKKQSPPDWLTDALTTVLDAHLEGTHAQGHDGQPVPIGCDTDGLVTAGNDQTQLTWMDAACDLPPPEDQPNAQPQRTVFTPRPGKCVEVNALWCSNLAGAAALLEKSPKQKRAAVRYAKAAAQASASFVRVFWDEKNQALHDHVRPDGKPNTQLRPNVCFACSLERSPLSTAQRRAVLDAVRDELLTPAGLRTLSPRDPAYTGHYAGPSWQRDAAYHQGTVWPWLLGAYAEGRLRAGDFSGHAKQQARAAIAPLLASLESADHPDASLGQLHEIHNATPAPGSPDTGSSDASKKPDAPDAPGTPDHHAPRGCIAQAWSVAEVLRITHLTAKA